jgi:hypothetical protein
MLSGIFIAIAGLLVNATRGVWLAVLIASLLVLRRLWIWIVVASPVLVTSTAVGYLMFGDSTFVRKITDPVDLYERFEYWLVAQRMIAAHPFLGVGHNNFGKVYLDYVTSVGTFIDFDIGKVFVADSMFLTTAVEHGILGVISLLGFLGFVKYLLRRTRLRLERSGLAREAQFVRCSEFALIIYVGAGLLADVHLFTKATKYAFILIGLGLAQGARYLPTDSRKKATQMQEV